MFVMQLIIVSTTVVTPDKFYTTQTGCKLKAVCGHINLHYRYIKVV